MILLGGGRPPRTVMTSAMQSLADLLPLSHLVGGLRQALLGTPAIPALWWPLAVAALAVTVAVRWRDVVSVDRLWVTGTG